LVPLEVRLETEVARFRAENRRTWKFHPLKLSNHSLAFGNLISDGSAMRSDSHLESSRDDENWKMEAVSYPTSWFRELVKILGKRRLYLSTAARPEGSGNTQFRQQKGDSGVFCKVI
jgi:hypothetical protein